MSGVSRWVSEGVSATLANSPVYTNNLKETLTENASVISLTHILMCQSGQLRLIATGALVGWLALLAWPRDQPKRTAMHGTLFGLPENHRGGARTRFPPTARPRRRFVEPRSAGSHLAIADATQKGYLDLPKFKEIRRWPQKHLVLVVGMVQVWSEFPVDPSWDRARVRNCFA